LKYFDTSVILLPILKDPRREKALKELGDGGITSELGLVELVSYLSRNINDDPLPYAIKLLKDYNIVVKSVTNQKQTFLGGINNVMYFAINIAKEVKLRTLDLLHLTYAVLLGADEFVTADKEFEKGLKFLSRNGVALKMID